MYWERQRGGLCRLHSLNAFFGYQKFSDSDFINLSREFDERQLRLFGQTCSSQNFDIVGSDQLNLVSFILSKFGIATRYYAINEHLKRPLIIDCDKFFVYDAGHIWLMKKENEKWHRIDSLSGISRTNINYRQKNIGFILPVTNLAREYNDVISRISWNTGNIKRNYLGDDEILIGRAIELLRIQLANREHKYPHIKQLICDYYEYIEELSTGKYNNTQFVCSKMPKIMACLKRLIKK